MNAPTIRFESVNKWYGDFHALKDISLDINDRSVVILCGPSGSGKSTLLRCVNGLERVQSGRVLVMGSELVGSVIRSTEFRSNIGMVFQRFSLYPHMTALDNVTLALRKVRRMPRRSAEARAQAMLGRVGVGDKAYSYPAQLSGGQQQRVAIARALVLEPRIMLFDEPTSALDPEMIREVLDVLRDLARSGITMLIVSHEMGFAREVANTVVFMDQGQVVEVTPADQFFHKPNTARAQQFLDKVIHH